LPTDRYVTALQRLLEIAPANLDVALTHAANVLADTLAADKVDTFLYDDSRDSLVAVGKSTQPLSVLQQQLGLDVLQLSNGGRVVEVFKTGQVFRTGNLQDDPEELRGVKEGMGIRSKLGVPLEVGGKVRGAIMVASLKPDFFTAEDEAFAASAVRWVGWVTHHAELVADLERRSIEAGRTTAAEEIIAELSHDLRNHLAPVSFRLYTLRKKVELGRTGELIEDIDGALRSVGRLSGLLGSLLDVSRIDAGQYTLHTQAVDLGLLAREAAEVLSTELNPIVVQAAEAVVAQADTERLRQCLDNILSNAVKHSPRGGEVTVIVTHTKQDERDFGLIQIIDQGPGIPEALMPHVFERFVTGEKRGGMGLGLYLTRRIIVAHGGDVSADRAPGHGARFSIKLPLYS
jgi:two-component system OmpR family sensor kinase